MANLGIDNKCALAILSVAHALRAPSNLINPTLRSKQVKRRIDE
jgi:hypothetical protein